MHLGGDGSPLHWANGTTRVARATGLSHTMVRAGVRKIQARAVQPPAPSGAGLKALSDRQPGLLAALERYLELVTHGNPMSPLRCLSERGAFGHRPASRWASGQRAVQMAWTRKRAR